MTEVEKSAENETRQLRSAGMAVERGNYAPVGWL
jgi:hypothetical protein